MYLYFFKQNYMKNILFTFSILVTAINISAQCAGSWLINSNSNNGNTVLFPVPTAMLNDTQNNLIMTGEFDTPFIYQGINYNSAMLTDMFVVKTNGNSNNSIIWSKHFFSTISPSSSEVHPVSLINGNSSSLYITGYFKGNVSFDSYTLTESGNGWDAFVIKLNAANGNVVWAKSFGTNAGTDQFHSIDLNNNLLYLSGTASPSLTLNSFTVNANGNTPTMIAVIDTNGTVINASSYGASGVVFNNNIKVIPGGDLLFTCNFNNSFTMGNTNVTTTGYHDFLISRINKTTLAPIWVKFGGSIYDDYSTSMTVDQNANTYLLFNFSKTMNWGTQSITSRGDKDIGLSKIDSTGAIMWVKNFGGPLTEYSGKIKMFNDSLLVTATCGDSVKFSGGINLNNQNKGLLNPLLVKFDNNGNRLDQILGNDTTSNPPYYLFNGPGPLSIDNNKSIYWGGAFLNHLSLVGLNTILSGNNNSSVNSFLIKICDLKVSIPENQKKAFQLKIYPNPGNELFTISGIESNGEVEVYNSLGNLVRKTKTIGDRTQIDLTAEYPGIYFIKYSQSSNSYTAKIIKE